VRDETGHRNPIRDTQARLGFGVVVIDRLARKQKVDVGTGVAGGRAWIRLASPRMA
jgi:hypothetical protein